MCGRYTLTRQEGVIEEMEAALGQLVLRPRFNIAPTQPAPVVVEKAGARQFEIMRWGLLPRVSKKKPPLMINARSEGVMDRPIYRDAVVHRRCLVPADGFFEWTVDGKQRRPMYFHPTPRRVFAFAGIWMWNGEITSFAILTRPPNELVAPIHDRMPAIIDHADYATWLSPATDVDAARALIHAQPIADWTAERVSMRVNTANNDDPACIELAQPPAQSQLF
jgi:putative SOS response-associated peptidase YedK